jgi:hypothetical protein
VKRFNMRIDPAWRPLVLVGGAIKSNSYVDVTAEAVTFHFGYAFNHTEDRNDIYEIKPREWPWWAGIGWRTNLRGTVGIIGSYKGVVEVAFTGKSKAWGFFPLNRIAVSLEDPEGFIAELADRNGADPEETPAVKRQGRAAAPRRRTTKRPTRRSKAS